jgi:N4-gp56 family major capsid protein
MANSNYMTTAVSTGVNATAVSPQSYNNTLLSALVLTVYSKDIEFAAQPVMRFDQFAEIKTDLSAQPGNQITFFKYNNLTRGGALTEGTPLTTQALSGAQVSITVGEYGNAVSASELLIQTALDNVMSSTARLLGYDYAAVSDELARDILETSSNVVLAGDVASADSVTSTDILTLEEVKDAVEILATNLTPKINNDHYVMFVHPHQSRGLRDDTNWITVGKLDPQRLYNGEIGRIDDVVFIETTQVSVDANAAATPVNVYSGIMLGANAFGKAIALPVEMRDNGVIDFQRERQLAWYSIMGVAVLNEDNIVVVKTA